MLLDLITGAGVHDHLPLAAHRELHHDTAALMLKCSGTKEVLLERLQLASSDILLRLTEGEDDLEPAESLAIYSRSTSMLHTPSHITNLKDVP